MVNICLKLRFKVYNNLYNKYIVRLKYIQCENYYKDTHLICVVTIEKSFERSYNWMRQIVDIETQIKMLHYSTALKEC